MTVTKLAISLNPDLAFQLKQDAYAKGESVSGWIAEAIATRLRQETMKKWVADYQAEFGEFTDEEVAKVRAAWPG